MIIIIIKIIYNFHLFENCSCSDESKLAVLLQKYDRCLRSWTSKVCDVHTK